MGEADVILGIKIMRDQAKVSKVHYIEKVLKRLNMFVTTPISIPMDQHFKFRIHDKETVSRSVRVFKGYWISNRCDDLYETLYSLCSSKVK